MQDPPGVLEKGSEAAAPARDCVPGAAQLRLLVEQASDGIFLADLRGQFTYVNETGCRMFGCGREDIVGKAILDLVPPGEIERVRAARSALLENRVYIGEWALPRSDGTRLPVEVSAKILPDGQLQGIVRDISERKAREAEHEARQRAESERRWLQAVVDTMPLGVLVFRPGERLFFNRRTEELLGMRLSASGGSEQYLSRILFPDGRPVPHAELPSSRALRGATVFAEDYVVERADGSRVPVLASVGPIRDAEGRVIGAVGAFQDVSERVLLDQRIRTNERTLQAIFDILPVGVWLADKNGSLLRTNPAGERVWEGCRLVDMSGYGQYKGWWVETGKPIAPDEWGMARAVTRGEASLRELIRIQCFDGSFKTVIHYAMPLRNEAGEIEGGVVVIEDITLLHEEQERRRASEQLLRTVFDILPVGLWITDRSGKIALVNPAGERLWQGARYVGPEQYGEYKAWWLETGQPVAAGEWGLNRALKSGQTSRAEAIRIQCFDGSFKTVLNFAAPILSPGGEITGAIAVNEDITALQRTQDDLRSAVTDREHLLAIVSHDLRNPVAVILSAADALAAEAARLSGGDTVSRLAALLRRTATGMSGLINDLLEVSVDRAGRSMLALAPVDVAELVARAAASARPLLEGKSIGLEVQAREPVPPLRLDAERILRVFANLLENAAKFTDAGGRVVLAAEPVAGGVRFSVANSGPALLPEQLAMMFQPFWQAARGDARGTGLGLSICRSIIEAHGGTIWAEPAAGQRLRVSFVLSPVKGADGPGAGEAGADQ